MDAGAPRGAEGGLGMLASDEPDSAALAVPELEDAVGLGAGGGAEARSAAARAGVQSTKRGPAPAGTDGTAGTAEPPRGAEAGSGVAPAGPQMAQRGQPPVGKAGTADTPMGACGSRGTGLQIPAEGLVELPESQFLCPITQVGFNIMCGKARDM